MLVLSNAASLLKTLLLFARGGLILEWDIVNDISSQSRKAYQTEWSFTLRKSESERSSLDCGYSALTSPCVENNPRIRVWEEKKKGFIDAWLSRREISAQYLNAERLVADRTLFTASASANLLSLPLSDEYFRALSRLPTKLHVQGGTRGKKGCF